MGPVAEPVSVTIPTVSMPLFTADEIREITSAKVLAGEGPSRKGPGIRRVVTDSREVRTGDLFVALQGERFDGHEFLHAVFQEGAVGALVHQHYTVPASLRSGTGKRRPAPLILGVPDPLVAFQQLAAHHRNRFVIPVVAVTGSNGKTTTKDMVACVLAERWETFKTEGNLNNRIGVPKTLLRLTARHEAAVVEMGVDHRGQTSRLCEIAGPTIGLITNIGPDHLEFFGTLEASAAAKGELLDQLPYDGAAVLNADDRFFHNLASRARCPVVSFGLSMSAQVRAEDVAMDPRRGTTFQLILPGRARGVPVTLRVYGSHNLSNALAAAAVGYVLGLSGPMIARGLARFKPATMRSQVLRVGGLRVINDCYNANPASMKAAIGLLHELGAGARTIAVLGDMLELGPNAPEWHREVGGYVAQQGIQYLIACGALGQGIAEGARGAGMAADRVQEATDAEAAAHLLTTLLRDGDVLLLKGSRGMRMEQILEALKKQRGTRNAER